MKAWILHDSHFGNGQVLAETIGAVLQKEIDVEVGHIKKVSPRRVAQDKPDLIIVGTAIRIFSTSMRSKTWIRRLKNELRKVKHIIPLGVVFVTHAMKKQNVDFMGKRFHKILDRGIAIGEVYPGWLSGRVKETQGPLVEGTVEDFEHIAQGILQIISKSCKTI
jgi:menaquinone-dependent protoporphyrinogen IX oxidase